MPHPEQVVVALQHDGIHAKTHRPLEARVLPVALQGVADLGAALRRGGVDVGNRAARTGLDRLELRHALFRRNLQQVEPVLIVRRQFAGTGRIADHDIRPEACHADSGMSAGPQFVIEPCQRGLAEHQHRVAVAELVQGFHASGPLPAGRALFLGIKTYQPRLHAEKIAEPLGSDGPHVVSLDLVVPDRHAHRLLHLVERDMQRQHARSTQDHVVVLELGLDQRHARQLTLRQEGALRIDHHPGPVKLQPGFRQQGFLHLHPGAGLDGINPQPGDHRPDVPRRGARCFAH